MRILHVAQPTEAGVANVVLGLLEDQQSRGWDVHLACPAATGYLGDRAQKLGITTHAWAATRSPGPQLVREVKSLRSIVDRTAPDVVVLHASKAGLAGRLVLRGSVPTVFMPHSWSFEAVEGAIGRVSALWERAAARWTTLNVLVSERERALGEKARCLAARTIVVPNGVDPDRWVPQDRRTAADALGLSDAPRVVVVGRLARQKGQDVLLRAWPRIRSAVPGAQLEIVGDGPDGEALRGLLTDGAAMHPGGDPLPWYSAADVVVMPSRWEGMPLVMLEAMACGRSVVATDVAGVREVLPDASAIVPIDDESALADQVTRRLRDADLRASDRVANARRIRDGFDIRTSTQRMAEALTELTGAGGA